MSRSRVVTVVIMACALLAAILFGAAAVLGWALARPIGVVSGIAALANIALISAPTGPRARRLALVVGATVLVIAAATGAWGFIADVPWWLCLMPIAGAVLMVPEVLDLMATTNQSRPESAEEPAVAQAAALPSLSIEVEESPDEHLFFQDRSSPSAPSEPSPVTALPEEIDEEDTLRHLPDTSTADQPAVEITHEADSVPVPSPEDAPSADSPADVAPARGRRAVLPDDWDEEVWDEDDEDEDEPPMPLGRRAR